MLRHFSFILTCSTLLGLIATEASYPPARGGLAAPDRLQAAIDALAEQPFDAPRSWIAFQVDLVSPGTQAEALGIVPGDRLVALDQHVFGLFSYTELLSSFRSSTAEQTLHWETSDGSRKQAAIQPGRFGLDLHRDNVYEGIAGIGTDTPSAAIRLAASMCIDDPPLAESALALALQSEEPPSPAAAWIVWTIARCYAGDLETCIDSLLQEHLPGEIEDWRRVTPLALKAAARLNRSDLVDALLQRWPECFVDPLFRVAAQRLPDHSEQRPLWQQAQNFIARRPIWPQHPDRFAQSTNDVWQDGQFSVKTGIDRYCRLILQAPERDRNIETGLLLNFDLRVEALKGEYRYPGQLWMHIDTDGHGGTDYFWSTYGSDHFLGTIVKMQRHENDPLLVSLARPIPDRDDRWHRLECWLHDHRMECFIDGQLIIATDLRRPVTRPRFILHIQSAHTRIKNLQWYQFDLRLEHDD